MNWVSMGLRPEWPSGNRPQGSAYELWEQIGACWNQAPNERPTAPEVQQTLTALYESQHQKPMVSVVDPDVETMVRVLGHVDDGPEQSTLLGWLW